MGSYTYVVHRDGSSTETTPSGKVTNTPAPTTSSSSGSSTPSSSPVTMITTTATAPEGFGTAERPNTAILTRLDGTKVYSEGRHVVLVAPQGNMPQTTNIYSEGQNIGQFSGGVPTGTSITNVVRDTMGGMNLYGQSNVITPLTQQKVDTFPTVESSSSYIAPLTSESSSQSVLNKIQSVPSYVAPAVAGTSSERFGTVNLKGEQVSSASGWEEVKRLAGVSTSPYVLSAAKPETESKWTATSPRRNPVSELIVNKLNLDRGNLQAIPEVGATPIMKDGMVIGYSGKNKDYAVTPFEPAIDTLIKRTPTYKQVQAVKTKLGFKKEYAPDEFNAFGKAEIAFKGSLPASWGSLTSNKEGTYSGSGYGEAVKAEAGYRENLLGGFGDIINLRRSLSLRSDDLSNIRKGNFKEFYEGKKQDVNTALKNIYNPELSVVTNLAYQIPTIESSVKYGMPEYEKQKVNLLTARKTYEDEIKNYEANLNTYRAAETKQKELDTSSITFLTEHALKDEKGNIQRDENGDVVLSQEDYAYYNKEIAPNVKSGSDKLNSMYEDLSNTERVLKYMGENTLLTTREKQMKERTGADRNLYMLKSFAGDVGTTAEEALIAKGFLTKPLNPLGAIAELGTGSKKVMTALGVGLYGYGVGSSAYGGYESGKKIYEPTTIGNTGIKIPFKALGYAGLQGGATYTGMDIGLTGGKNLPIKYYDYAGRGGTLRGTYLNLPKYQRPLLGALTTPKGTQLVKGYPTEIQYKNLFDVKVPVTEASWKSVDNPNNPQRFVREAWQDLATNQPNVNQIKNVNPFDPEGKIDALYKEQAKLEWLNLQNEIGSKLGGNAKVVTPKIVEYTKPNIEGFRWNLIANAGEKGVFKNTELLTKIKEAGVENLNRGNFVFKQNPNIDYTKGTASRVYTPAQIKTHNAFLEKTGGGFSNKFIDTDVSTGKRVDRFFRVLVGKPAVYTLKGSTANPEVMMRQSDVDLQVYGNAKTYAQNYAKNMNVKGIKISGNSAETVVTYKGETILDVKGTPINPPEKLLNMFAQESPIKGKTTTGKSLPKDTARNMFYDKLDASLGLLETKAGTTLGDTAKGTKGASDLLKVSEATGASMKGLDKYLNKMGITKETYTGKVYADIPITPALSPRGIITPEMFSGSSLGKRSYLEFPTITGESESSVKRKSGSGFNVGDTSSRTLTTETSPYTISISSLISPSPSPPSPSRSHSPSSPSGYSELVSEEPSSGGSSEPSSPSSPKSPSSPLTSSPSSSSSSLGSLGLGGLGGFPFGGSMGSGTGRGGKRGYKSWTVTNKIRDLGEEWRQRKFYPEQFQRVPAVQRNNFARAFATMGIKQQPQQKQFIPKERTTFDIVNEKLKQEKFSTTKLNINKFMLPSRRRKVR